MPGRPLSPPRSPLWALRRGGPHWGQPGGLLPRPAEPAASSEVPPNPAAAPGVPVGPDCPQLTHGVPGALVSEGPPEGDEEALATVNGGRATPPPTIPTQAEDTVGR
eukprot:8685444-Pyramimonas_sp.AAC.1